MQVTACTCMKGESKQHGSQYMQVTACTYMKGVDEEHGAYRVAIKVNALSFLCLDLAQLLAVVHQSTQQSNTQ